MFENFSGHKSHLKRLAELQRKVIRKLSLKWKKLLLGGEVTCKLKTETGEEKHFLECECWLHCNQNHDQNWLFGSPFLPQNSYLSRLYSNLQDRIQSPLRKIWLCLGKTLVLLIIGYEFPLDLQKQHGQVHLKIQDNKFYAPTLILVPKAMIETSSVRLTLFVFRYHIYCNGLEGR